MAFPSGISRNLLVLKHHAATWIALAVLLANIPFANSQQTDFGQSCLPVPVFKFRNMANSSHMLTIHEPQKVFLKAFRPDYKDEGIAYYAYATKGINTLPVYRMYAPTPNVHLYTTSTTEKSQFISKYPDTIDEGIDHWIPAGAGGGAVEIGRYRRPSGSAETFYASNEAEAQLYSNAGMVRASLSFFAFPNSSNGVALPNSVCEPGPVWRFRHKTAVATFFTPSEAEKRFLEMFRPDYESQGIAFYAHGPSAESSGIYRLYHPGSSTHLYTASEEERNAFTGIGASYEGVNFTLQANTKAASVDLINIYRLKHATTGRFLYALSESERDNWIKSFGFKDDGSKLTALKAQKPSGNNGNKPPVIALSAPTFVSLSPANVQLIATTSDPDGSVAKVEFYVGAQKLSEVTASPFNYIWQNAQPGTYAVMAVATDDKGARTSSAAVSVVVSQPAEAFSAASKDAARLLTQATFGIRSRTDIDSTAAKGVQGWLAEQFGMGFNSHVAYVNEAKAREGKVKEEQAYEAIWQQWLNEPGQLRARMAFALSQIFVVSNIAPDLDTYAMASYMDLLNRNAFGNYRTLLGEVTLHPTMGYYLNMQGSKKEDTAKGTHPNENYAREVLQLFSIGLYKLNTDGSRVVGADGKPVSTYDESVVKGFARAFTGWNFAGNNTSDPKIFDPAKENWTDPMQAWEMMHEPGTKQLLDGKVLPAGQTARKDMDDALDNIFQHPNVGPFIGRQLIQRFVTSNPSPAYIGRVAAVFNNNGSGTRGDLKAVLTAVLTDAEARSITTAAGTTFGKQREPVIRFANFLRGMNATSPSGRNKIWYLDDADEGLGQSPLLAPSVFNFFSPNYRQPGALAAANLVAPEFQITTETSMVGQLNFFATLVKNASYGSGDTKLTLNLEALNALAADPVKLIDAINLQFFNGAMTAQTRGVMLAKVVAISASKPADRTKAALMLTALSPEYAIQK